MAITFRKLLENARKLVDEFGPEALDWPVYSSHSASGTIEAVYGPYDDVLDEEEACMTDEKPNTPYISIILDH